MAVQKKDFVKREHNSYIYIKTNQSNFDNSEGEVYFLVIFLCEDSGNERQKGINTIKKQ